MANRSTPAPRAGGANKTCQFKLVLLGESAVGKSSLVLRFVKGQFHEYQESTIGAAFLTQTLCADGKCIKNLSERECIDGRLGNFVFDCFLSDFVFYFHCEKESILPTCFHHAMILLSSPGLSR
ncbi:unnamed protein product [Haemonchus placei]|uniref:RAB5A n=1 Tax=Haemonchus placei TaxID=6290 RepID=A0A0N4WTE3_HAEPC|nr:unnamed protein product [Haemonchus placei]